MQSAKYILKNFQTGLSQNHPKHGFLKVSQIIPLCFLPYIWVIYFLEFNHLFMLLIFVFFQKNILDLLIKQGNEKYMN